MAIKKRILRRPGKGSAVVLSPEMVSLLADPGDIEGAVRLRIRMGDPRFDGLSDEVDADVRAGVEIVRKLWPRYADAAVEHCVRRYGPGTRPWFWWTDKPRSFVAPYNGDAADAARFDRERRAADLAFLEQHKLLSGAEKTALAESKTKPVFSRDEELL